MNPNLIFEPIVSGTTTGARRGAKFALALEAFALAVNTTMWAMGMSRNDAIIFNPSLALTNMIYLTVCGAAIGAGVGFSRGAQIWLNYREVAPVEPSASRVVAR